MNLPHTATQRSIALKVHLKAMRRISLEGFSRKFAFGVGLWFAMSRKGTNAKMSSFILQEQSRMQTECCLSR